MTRRNPEERRFSRRELVEGVAAAGAAASFAGLFAACGGGEGGGAAAPPESSEGSPGTTAGTTADEVTTADAVTTAATTETEIKRGGRLRVGHVGGGKAESFNPAQGSTYIDVSRYYNLYDPLVFVNPDFSYSPGLALEWTQNADSTIWEIKLRPDVVFHDGKPFTADDVIYSFEFMGDAGHVAHSSVANIRLGEVRKIDDLTLSVPLKSANARLSDSFTQQQAVMIQNGAKSFENPVGTGPFKFESFTVGERSLCLRNENYWQEGKPYVDEWEDISLDDPTARLNALLSGEIDAMTQVPLAQAKAEKDKGDIQIIDATSPSVQVLYMAVDLDPFTDARVRQAFRLIADRQALVDGALFGFGTPGNDLFGKGLPFFADDLPVREQDLDQAKSLLKEAGMEGLKVTLHTAEIVPGFVEAATLFAEQAKGAGVDVQVKLEPANAFFDTSLLYTKLNFGSSFWTAGSLVTWYEQALLSEAVWNETHWRDPAFDQLIRDAQAAPTEEAASEVWHEIQQIQYDEGGYIVWANINLVDAAANYVKGIVPNGFFNLGGPNYRDLWLDTQ